MDNRSTFLYHLGGAKEGRGRGIQPLNGLRCQAYSRRRDREIRPGGESVTAEPTGQKWMDPATEKSF